MADYCNNSQYLYLPIKQDGTFVPSLTRSAKSDENIAIGTQIVVAKYYEAMSSPTVEDVCKKRGAPVEVFSKVNITHTRTRVSARVRQWCQMTNIIATNICYYKIFALKCFLDLNGIGSLMEMKIVEFRLREATPMTYCKQRCGQ